MRAARGGPRLRRGIAFIPALSGLVMVIGVLAGCSTIKNDPGSASSAASSPSTTPTVVPVDPRPFELTAAQLSVGQARYGDLPALAFDSPSRVIQCFIAHDLNSVTYMCQLKHHSYSVTKPVWLNCEGAVYSGIAIIGMHGYRPEFECRPAGESTPALVPQVPGVGESAALPQAAILPEGRSIQLSGVTCSVTGAGTSETVHCSQGGKAGFSISTSRYRLAGPERENGSIG